MTTLNLNLVFVIALVVGSRYNFCDSKIVEGHLVTHGTWHFLDRFCFLDLAGTFEYEIEYDAQFGYVSLLMYPDLQWGNVYNNPKAKTCQQKVGVLSIPDHQRLILMPYHPLIRDSLESGCEPVRRKRIFKYGNFGNSTINGNVTIVTTTTITTDKPQEMEETDYETGTRFVCIGKRTFRSSRARWWFVSVSSCNNTRGLDVKYKFRMTNGDNGNYWFDHFSADEFYILQVLVCFCFLYLFPLLLAILFAVRLKSRQLLHDTYKLFVASIVLQNAGIVALCIAYGVYASNGVGLPCVKLLGRVLEGVSEFIFMLLLYLLAKGFTVTRGSLRLASTIKLTIFSCLYIVIYALLFVFEKYTFDPGLVLYIYESPAGYGILVLRMLGWFVFVYAIIFTLKHYPGKSSFYSPFCVIYSLWFLSGPVVILISNHVLEKWVREKVAVAIQHCCMFVGHFFFLMLTRPSVANKRFPYHVRTTQFGFQSGNNSTNHVPMGNFEAHSYAQPNADGKGKNMDIFAVTDMIQQSEAATDESVGTGSDALKEIFRWKDDDDKYWAAIGNSYGFTGTVPEQR